MQVSLRARLTAWYSLLVVLTVAVFAAAVLLLHWRLLLKQFDDGLEAIAVTADNMFAEELEEVKNPVQAAAEMVEVVRAEDGGVQVLDATGASIGRATSQVPLPPDAFSPGASAQPVTLSGPDGQQWRVLVRKRSVGGHDYYIATGLPLTEALDQWRTLLRVSLIGLPLGLLFAAAGGWWL